MDVSPSVVASLSVLALLFVAGWNVRQRGAGEDPRPWLRLAAGAVIAVAAIAFVWTLTRPT